VNANQQKTYDDIAAAAALKTPFDQITVEQSSRNGARYE
jgi:hypothetical protein